VDTGNGSTTVSVAETQYAPCACSPLGKLWRTSRPHAPGAPPIWTTYTYDASGRTMRIFRNSITDFNEVDQRFQLRDQYRSAATLVF